MQSKEEFRKFITQKRSLLSKNKKEDLDNKVFNKLIKNKAYKNSKVIFCFVSFKNEVYTHKFIKYAIKDNKRVCVPKIISKEEGMKAVEIKSFQDLKSGAYGILEPLNFNLQIDEKHIDLALIPGMAFDKYGGRIGLGGGFYDRFLKKVNKNTLKLSLAYDFQIFDKVPVEKHDIRIDGIITNKKTNTINKWLR
ncbi:5-formyltetrahydrofolate cyclo-ligase [Clostridium aestuarii]|uniref:5-formyltetrahydrofolate cyclo-ligase n=1 Tax=Clostridium aestuarii TaxID=338193 RepID=A0ABT4D0B9_9CLOT|nr:5-formyltetrahydrofolate cyclo-ligase [Clostridium aestuarii]MCY6484684.1 5-formyltetrahydrofolate cyclo-ligase [Clostridium aestuarii]